MVSEPDVCSPCKFSWLYEERVLVWQLCRGGVRSPRCSEILPSSSPSPSHRSGLSGPHCAVMLPRSKSHSALTHMAALVKTRCSGLGWTKILRVKTESEGWRTSEGMEDAHQGEMLGCAAPSLMFQAARGNFPSFPAGMWPARPRAAWCWQNHRLTEVEPGSPSRAGGWDAGGGDGLIHNPAGFCSAAPAPAPSLFWETEHWRWTNVLRK